MTGSSTSDPLVGHVLAGRYEIKTRLARGGMATVYRAHDRRLDRVVAVKVMHDNLGDDTNFADRFDREARAAARLSDPHVVSVFDQGQDRGRPYIVMEFVQGCTLRNLITREAPFDPARALSLIEPVAAALAAAHESGLVHRDVKPENVLISATGHIKVADFGLARAVTSQTITAPRGLVIGTVSYMPPEVVTTGSADMRSDIYSTGIMLYEMLTGEKPHTGSSPIQVAYAHVNKSVPPPSQTLRDHHHAPLPDYLDALVVSCTRRDAGMRPRDGRELLARVRRARAAVLAGVDSDEALCAIMNPAAFRVGRSWPDQVTTGAPAQIRAGEHAEAQHNAARIPGAVRASTSPVATSGAGRRAPGQPIVTASTSQPAGVSSRGPVNPHSGHSWSSHALPPSRRASSPTRMERRTSEPARPSSSRWTQVSGSARPRTPMSPVDMGAARPARPPARPRPQSQRAPRFPDIAHDRVHRRRRGVVGFLLVLVLAIVIGLGSWWLAVGRFVSAPAIIGLSEPQAVAAAHAAGLQINFTERPDEQVPSGTIITTDPAAGSRLPRNSQVHAALSTGPQTYPMPSVVGLDKDAAADALEASNLQLGGVDEQYDATHPQGTVIAASATTGTQVPGTQGVTLTVSKGPAPVQVTDFTGKSVSSAQAALTQTGLSVSITQQNSDTVASGQVISQNPAGGQLPPGSTVTFVVSSGPQQVAVPDVRARTTDDATKVLQDAGFTVQVTMVDPNSPIHLNRVQRSDPAQGTAAAKGTTVGIYII